MTARQTLPRLWLMTDERLGEALWTALERLPRGSGIVFRHYSLPPRQRRALFERVRSVARRRRLRLVLAGTPIEARGWRADGVHGGCAGVLNRGMLRTAAAHHAIEMVAASRLHADIAFLSPVFPTRSHPGARVLGRSRFGLLARHARTAIIALGGMNARKMRGLPGKHLYGWAGIDAWSS